MCVWGGMRAGRREGLKSNLLSCGVNESTKRWWPISICNINVLLSHLMPHSGSYEHRVPLKPVLGAWAMLE